MLFKLIDGCLLPTASRQKGSSNAELDIPVEDGRLSVPEGVDAIGAGTFTKLSGVHTVALPDSVKVIRTGAFGDSEGLKRVEFGNGLESIEYGALSGYALKELIFACPATQPRISPMASGHGPAWRAQLTFPDIGTRPLGGLPMPEDITEKEAKQLFEVKKVKAKGTWQIQGFGISKKVFVNYYPELARMVGKFWETETDFHVALPASIDGAAVEKYPVNLIPKDAILYAPPMVFDKAVKTIRAATAVAWLEGDPLFSEDQAEHIRTFIAKSSADVADAMVNCVSAEAHARFGDMVRLKPELVDRIIEACAGNAALTAFWVDYKNRAKPRKAKDDALSLDAPKAPTMAELKRLWTFERYRNEQGEECVSLNHYKGQGANVIVPDYIGKYKVDYVGNAFADASHVESIGFENPDVHINRCMRLKRCTKLADSDGFIVLTAGSRRILTDYIGTDMTVRVPEGVTEVGIESISQVWDDYRRSCQPLTVYLPASVKLLGDWKLLRAHTGMVDFQCEIIPCDLHIANPDLEISDREPSPKLTVCAAPGSKAEAFAKEHGLTFIAE